MKTGLVSISLLLMTGAGWAQQQPTALKKLEALRLPSISGVRTYYSPGAEERAGEVRVLLEEAREFFRKELGTTVDLTLAVLDEASWRAVSKGTPYGIPHGSSAPYVLFMPATDDNPVTTLALDMKKSVSGTVLQRIAQEGMTYEEAARVFVNLIALHELGHLYTEASRVKPGNKWLNEFLATYHAYAFLAAKRPRLAEVWRAMNEVFSTGVTPTHRSLEDFERLYSGVGIASYGWYQAQFQERVARVYEERNLTFLKDVRDAFPRLKEGDDPVQSLMKNPEPIETVLERLEEISPGFMPWSERFRVQRK